jgi:hypothetical protein
MRHRFALMALLSLPPTPTVAQVGIPIGIPGVSRGIRQPVYPLLVQVPGLPVYYAPGGSSNYFFYDGMYWVLEGEGWYVSSWYDGPWSAVAPQGVPRFVLRVPVRYYRQPPAYFRGWPPGGPPRWGQHWGDDWERQNGGWDEWDRAKAPRPAPLPVYQKQYAGNRYPHASLQQALQGHNYRYEPHDASVKQAYHAQGQEHANAREVDGRQDEVHEDEGRKDKEQKDRGQKDGGGGSDPDG